MGPFLALIASYADLAASCVAIGTPLVLAGRYLLKSSEAAPVSERIEPTFAEYLAETDPPDGGSDDSSAPESVAPLQSDADQFIPHAPEDVISIRVKTSQPSPEEIEAAQQGIQNQIRDHAEKQITKITTISETTVETYLMPKMPDDPDDDPTS